MVDDTDCLDPCEQMQKLRRECRKHEAAPLIDLALIEAHDNALTKAAALVFEPSAKTSILALRKGGKL